MVPDSWDDESRACPGTHDWSLLLVVCEALFERARHCETSSEDDPTGSRLPFKGRWPGRPCNSHFIRPGADKNASEGGGQTWSSSQHRRSRPLLKSNRDKGRLSSHVEITAEQFATQLGRRTP